jgi:DNA-binding response OmpR family regulator
LLFGGWLDNLESEKGRGAVAGDAVALVIEDHRDISTLFGMVLEEAGFQTEIIRTGSAAVARLAEIVPDVVILDLHLPGVQGDEILRQIRADARLAKTRVIVITAYAALAKTLQGEADLVLLKPVDLNLLRRLVARLRSADGWAGDMPAVVDPGGGGETRKDA